MLSWVESLLLWLHCCGPLVAGEAAYLLAARKQSERERESVSVPVAYFSQMAPNTSVPSLSLVATMAVILETLSKLHPKLCFTNSTCHVQSIQTDTQDKLNLSQIALISWLYPLQQRLKLENLLPLTCALGTVHC